MTCWKLNKNYQIKQVVRNYSSKNIRMAIIIPTYYRKNKSSINNLRNLLTSINNQVYQDFSFKMKMYYPDTMHKIIERSGLSVANVWGSYDKEAFNENSNLQIYKCVIK